MRYLLVIFIGLLLVVESKAQTFPMVVENVSGVALNIRSTASTASTTNIITTLSPGSKLVALTSYSGNGFDWYWVYLPSTTTSGHYGWIARQSLSTGFVYSQAKPADKFAEVINAPNGLRVRQAPSTSGARIYIGSSQIVMPNGSYVAFTGNYFHDQPNNTYWHEIYLPDNCVTTPGGSTTITTGWCAAYDILAGGPVLTPLLETSAYAPAVSFSASTTTPNVGQSFTLFDNSTNTPLSWFWSVSHMNGTPTVSSTNQNYQLSLAASGDYTVYLAASNQYGTNSTFINNYLTVQGQSNPPDASIIASTTSGTSPLTVNFSSSYSNGTPISWSWNFGANAVPATSTAQNPGNVVFTNATSSTVTQSVQLQVDFGGGIIVTKNLNISVNPSTQPNDIFISATPTSGVSPLTVNLSASYTGTAPTSWFWQLYGSQTNNAFVQNPGNIVFLNQTGTTKDRTARCWATYSDGSQIWKEITISVQTDPVNSYPVADFTADKTTIQAGEAVQFTDLTTINPTSWNWTFGGPESYTASVQNPKVNFLFPGSYNVQLTAHNNFSSDTESKSGYITVNSNPLAPLREDYAEKRDHSSGYVADPVNAATGAFVKDITLFSLPANNSLLEFELFYNSRNEEDHFQTGRGWSHSFETRVDVNWNNTIWTIHHADGHESYHVINPDGVTSEPLYAGQHESLVKNSGGGFTLVKKNGEVWEFDQYERLTSVTDRNGNTTLINYVSAFGGSPISTVVAPGGRTLTFIYYPGTINIATVQDQSGRTVTLNYLDNFDSSTNLTSITNTNGETVSYGYNPANQLTDITDAKGNLILTNVYDADRRVDQQTDALGSVTDFAYDTPVAGATTVTNQLGTSRVYHHDESYRLVQSTDELGNHRYFEYDADHNLEKITDENGHEVVRVFDGDGNLISETDPLSNTFTFGYNTEHDLTSILGPLNQDYQFTYDVAGNLLNAQLPNSDNIQSTYDAAGNLVSSTDLKGYTTTYQYNAFGDLIQINRPIGTIDLTYDAVGRLTSTSDPEGSITEYFYDDADRLTKVKDALGDSLTFAYDLNGNLVSRTDKKGHTTTYEYDLRNRLEKIKAPEGNTTTFSYDVLDRLIGMTNALGKTTTYGYDAVGRLTSIADPLGHTTSYTYDAAGNRQSTTDPLGNTTDYTYDDANRLETISDALNNPTTITYDALGRMISVLNAEMQQTQYVYNDLGSLIQVIDAANVSTYYTYDDNQNLETITDPNGNLYQFTYDVLDRLLDKTDPEGNTYNYTYDDNGNLLTETAPNGVVTTYTYDAVNRPISATYSTGESYTYGFDENQNLISMSNALGTTSFVYDSLDRMVQATDLFGNVVGYGYDLFGNQTSITYPDGKLVQYAYDDANRLTSVQDWANNTTTYVYDLASNPVEVIYPNGTKIIRGFDDVGRLNSISNQMSGGTVLYESLLTLNDIGLTVQETTQQPSLPTFTAQSVASTYDDADRLVSNTLGVFSNDPSGNRTAQPVPGGTMTFQFTGANLLEQLSTISSTITYDYDPLLNRVQRTQDGVTTRYALDLSGELSQVLQEQDDQGNTTATYVYGLGLISRTDASDTHYYHFDANGNTVALTDASGALTDSYVYTPFGVEEAHNGTTNQPYRFLGMYGIQAEGNGLYHIRRRYYDAVNGRFVSQDPYPLAMTDPQTIHRFAYGLNDPVNRMDVNGLYTQGSRLTPTERAALLRESTKHQIEAQYWANRVAIYDDMENVFRSVIGALDYIMPGASLGLAIGDHFGSKVAGRFFKNYRQEPIEWDAAATDIITSAIFLGLDKGLDLAKNGLYIKGNQMGIFEDPIVKFLSTPIDKSYRVKNAVGFIEGTGSLLSMQLQWQMEEPIRNVFSRIFGN